MTMTLNSQLTSPNTAPATSVSPLDESGSSNTKWLNALKNDKRFIFKAASSASKAHQFLIASASTE